VSDLSRPSCFLAEWYRSEVTSKTIEDITAKLDAAAATMRAEGVQVQLIIALAVPTDEVLYGMFSAYSTNSIVLTCERAGIPVERLSSNVLLGSSRPPGGSREAGHTNGSEQQAHGKPPFPP
jgi:hypothetical protein